MQAPGGVRTARNYVVGQVMHPDMPAFEQVKQLISQSKWLKK